MPLSQRECFSVDDLVSCKRHHPFLSDLSHDLMTNCILHAILYFNDMRRHRVYCVITFNDVAAMHVFIYLYFEIFNEK